MTNKLLILFIFALNLSCSNPTTTTTIAQSGSTNIKVENFQKIIDTIYKSHPESVGLMVHIESPKNNISWSGSTGYSNTKNKNKLDPNQPVLIASSIKTYISAAILRLQEEGMLSIEDKIGHYLTPKTVSLFESDGYHFNKISIKHLLSHTSGIADYANDDYIEWIDKNQKYRWTRDEQMQLAVKVGTPLGEAQEVFSYADINFLLCTEVIEQVTKKPFYTAIRSLLKYDQLNLSNTWFPTLEDKPAQTAELAHQYWNDKEYGQNKIVVNWDSYDHDISWDLYGGGGIATTIKELSQFSYHLFNEKIIQDKEVLDLIKTDIKTKDGKSKNYRLGLAEANIKGLKCFGHGGFWGTIVFYIPQLDASISVCVLERNGKMSVIRKTLNTIVTELSNQLYPSVEIVSEKYELYKSKNAKTTLILFPGGGATAKETKEEFDIITAASANNISVLFMNTNSGLRIDKTTTKELAKEIEQVFKTNNLTADNTYIGGMSIGGNTALLVSNYLHKKRKDIAPKGVFIVDSPIDLYALYESSMKDITNPSFDEERLAEPRFIINYFEEKFNKDSILFNIQKVSPFINKSNYAGVPNLKESKLRFYTEPDSIWWKENRGTDFQNTNAYTIQQIANGLKTKNWNQFELIETKNKGYRANGERHPHSWSIVDIQDLIKWMKE